MLVLLLDASDGWCLLRFWTMEFDGKVEVTLRYARDEAVSRLKE
jgi:hypothetical protein